MSKNIGLEVLNEALHDEASQVEDVVDLPSPLDLSSEKARKKRETVEIKLAAIKPDQVNQNCMLIFTVLSFSCIQFKHRNPKKIKSQLKAEIDQNLQRNM